MPKLHQHQQTGRYFTRIAFRGSDGDTGHIVTKQIHPDGVRWLKAQGTRLGGELQPDGAEFHLAEQGWLYTLGEVPEWGTIDWAPDWSTLAAPTRNSYKEAAIRAQERRRQNQGQPQVPAAGNLGEIKMPESPANVPAQPVSRAPTVRANHDRYALGPQSNPNGTLSTNPYYAQMLRELKTGGAFLERCAESMYRLREPRNSQTIPYSSISPNKKDRNRQIARDVMTVAIQRVQRVTSQEEIEQVFDAVAREFYTHVAPMKSQTDPLEHRSEYAKTWYRQRARDFMYHALYPELASGAATGQAQVASHGPGGKSVGGSTSRPALSVNSSTVNQPALQSNQVTRPSLPADGTSVADGSGAHANAPVAPEPSQGSDRNQAQPTTGEIIAGMVGIGIILLLFVIVLILIF